MSATAPDLSGVFLKLQRAEEHIQTFRNELAAFRERDPAPFGFRTEETVRPDNSIQYNLHAIVREKPPRELALPAGDAIQNIRSALDHLVYELATPRGRRTRKLQFPIFTDECEFKVLSPPMLKSITGDERTLIERVQPYAATNVPSDDPLTVLRKLSNRDKHRLLVPMIAALSEHGSWVTSDNADIRFTYLAGGACGTRHKDRGVHCNTQSFRRRDEGVPPVGTGGTDRRHWDRWVRYQRRGTPRIAPRPRSPQRDRHVVQVRGHAANLAGSPSDVALPPD